MKLYVSRTVRLCYKISTKTVLDAVTTIMAPELAVLKNLGEQVLFYTFFILLFLMITVGVPVGWF